MKTLINNLLNYLGYSITKRKNFDKIYRTLDSSIKNLLNKKNPLIFDVGAHEGETIERFLKIFDKPIFHCFEPQENPFKILKQHQYKDISFNNFALGDKNENKEINILNDDASSSLFKLHEKSENLGKLEMVNSKIVSIKTLDDYINSNNIDKIDLLKIDVQGYEDKVLSGGSNSLKKIFLIELEIIFIDYYENKKSFYDIEKILNKNDFELYSLSTPQFAKNYQIKWLDALYINKKFNFK